MNHRWHGALLLVGLLAGAADASAQDGLATAVAPAGSPGQDIYVVAPGDTLWGISQRFFGAPDQWPGVWSVNNDEITNPHYIYPGQVVRFSAGTVITPPSLGLSASTATPYDESFQPVARFWSSNRQCGIYVPFADLPDSRRFTAPAFVADDMQPLGKLVGAAEGRSRLAEGDVVFLRFENLEDVHCGDVYSVYAPDAAVKHPRIGDRELGTSYRVLGEVRITDVGDRMATAEIVHSYFEIGRGALLTDRLEVVADVRIQQTDRNVGGYLVGGLRGENLLTARTDIVFIDRGRSDGVQTGDTFWVVRSGDEMYPRTLDSIEYPESIVGRIVVFAADEYHATAVVTDATRDLRIGDRITTYIERLDVGSDADIH
ncbi:LysM peptidoglycan-binding domain-containing protein [Myxococcota bacterium]|nr:LysM peptidoglycan-binding domain-containing protein [Myxococcota bacterium]